MSIDSIGSTTRRPNGRDLRLGSTQNSETHGYKSPIRKTRGLQFTEESDSEYVPSKTSSTYRSATSTRYLEARPVSPQKCLEDYSFEEIPSQDPVVRFLFQRVQKMENDRVRSQEPDWGKLRPGPFTERIKRSRQAIGCKGLSDKGQCLLFLSSLIGAALNWFYQLEPKTVDSFDELGQIFLNHFMIQTNRLYSADYLYMIRQREDKPLREYVACFSHEYSKCPKTYDMAAYGTFKSGLQSSHFRYLVHSSNWRTYDKLMKQAAIHVKAEYFNSKFGPSARHEEPASNGYPRQGSTYGPRRNDEPSAGHKRKDDRDNRQGGFKKR
ncbi:PREDICTED: uncharacterized protein LOC103326789 [Prunus mume]|uniref:Uncharacterized protein LOC103326789 n=1 Tax=Prunus mume TaxID=102107 RepID=A0ABM0NN36_PRUMU|nr:PREDICTED: uncharacterized protein LOC103326789 [Prunus mume]